MKITVLDGYTENPGDLSWDWLEALGETSIYDCTPDGLIAERSAGCEIIITNKTPLRRETLEKLPELRYIGLLSTGYNVSIGSIAKKRAYPFATSPPTAPRRWLSSPLR
mgnify:CR=1 FL=1